ncbi:hypothetical protein RPMA_18095 [Tardiphaga alba]|uniref:Uncharacterized protein n=1 Tax=Tardiphaga alba TaxID=340268 RepID=A0ABX8ADZ3_9BRAD|nr:hypothetical protein [Tardiphaga alba]QUS40530.1 hypothetical protein RPMA_18095 [Tardiphaga alba]
MNNTPERDRGLLGLVERLIKRPESGAAAKAAQSTDDGAREGLDPVVPEDKAPVSLEPELAIESTRILSRAELADTMLRGLKAVDGCPRDGLEITIYGARPWNALLRITPAAGSIDAAAWRARVQNMVLLFRDQYQIAEDGN